MDPSLILFILRLLSAVVLLGFLGLVIWYIYQDLQVTMDALSVQGQQKGRLRVIANESSAPAIGSIFALRPVTSIGRASNNTIVLEDSYTSSEHALITRRGDVWWVEDLGSRNGMLLNDLPLEEATVVSTGDVITIGAAKLKIEF